MTELIQLNFLDLAIALGLMAIAIGLSIWEKIGLELNLAIATGRTILQLLVLGYILDFIFALNNVLAVLAILAVMLTVAAIVAKNRITQKMPQVLPLVWGSMFLSTAFTLIYTNFLIIQPDKWFQPQYVIPLAGVVLGNAMNAAAITGERLVSTINASHMEIETHLSLGATPQQAIQQYQKDSIRAGLIPTINQMMIIGMVTIPGFMSGLIISGVDYDKMPFQAASEAASYQILLMFMVALSNLLTTILLTKALSRQFFNSNFQLVR
ncbi:ABC transporter permease [Rivularia sp. UHCC 0363]|uniref:ABC transporter permease n=1 Tax=Rivularia sp. UHCC 0363 TaxID=3110244 RepID=UPI002B1F8F01|nr:iron export ABC transporter permease subunit FetB [Rivularia sp. UHCC 0363]MEA5597214.1 iron export ABC transporter permease subunit FetB [Rivularia sp. UHCC 0363]